MCNAFGIVNYEGTNVKVNGLQDYRPAGAFSFLGRYRLVDFPISNMSNSGINHIQVYTKSNPRSLIEHLGTGRHYNINSKRGKLHFLTSEKIGVNDFYSNDISCYLYNMQYIEDVNYPYVVLAPSHIVYRQDFAAMLETHMESGADISILYQSVDNAKECYINCDVLELNRQKGVSAIERNRGNAKNRNISLETYILSKELFVNLVKKAAKTSSLYWFRDIVNDECTQLDIRGIAHRGFVACINDFPAFYNANMSLLDYSKAMDLFKEDWPIYTRTNDSCPTQYYPTSTVKRSFVANGCTIEGEIDNSVIGRGCVIKKGAVIKNSVLLPGVVVGEDVHVENVVVDKKARIQRKKDLIGDVGAPLYVKRNDRI